MLFGELSGYYDRLSSISSRLEMIELMSEVFRKADKGEVKSIIYITQGVLAPPYEGVEFGMAEKMVEESIAIATGFSKEDVEKEYRKQGDMGQAAQALKEKTRMRPMRAGRLSVNEFYETMGKIAGMSGAGSKEKKINALAAVIGASSPQEAKYAAKYPLDELRLGLGDATMLEALSLAYTQSREKKAALENAYNICSDLGLVGETIALKGIQAIERFKVTLFKPIRPALAERLPTADEILEKMHGKAAVEQKYDGFRCQIHKEGRRVRIFSRRLEDTTEMFPDLVKAAIEEIRGDKLIIDGEALAYNDETQEFLPFQETIQRKRKHGIAEKAAELPLHLFAFDIMMLDGEDLMAKPYHERREALERVLKGSMTLQPSTRIITSEPKELEEFFERSIENGLEGIVAKELDSRYIAGARKYSWIKMKRSYKGELSDTVDLVVVGYYRGKGMRSEFKFGGLLCATYNEKRDVFETVSRLGSGFTEAQMVELKRTLAKQVVKGRPVRVDAIVEPDFWVYPKYVVTVKADEITKSPTHTCGRRKQEDGTEAGFALRFPRLVGDEAIRKDKSPEEATTTKEISEMYENQKRVKVADS
ncbi:ATP-dependent DNA ligase [Candidatus Marsarchaeota archaeon]|jgi:DNA ligase-1|nr:ATP-dependent DNA ligase [Candidatus Marsarchaeota archaeon]MCL5115442.1 ATP-dependent DNA ligase [Candidatus Marsarchaeota archaeon]